MRGLELFFDPRRHASVTVHGASDRLLLPDDSGRVVLMRDAELAEPGATLDFSEQPLRAQPLTAE